MKYLDHIEYVYAVYKEGSFTRAADKLYISQPSLSMTVKKAERDLGYPIFERGGKQLSLTPMGEKYIRVIEKILGIISDLEAETQDLQNLRAGSVSLGCNTYAALCVLPNILRRFHSLYPNIEVQMTVESSSVLTDKLREQTLDLVIDNSTEPDPKYIYTPFMTENILIGVPREFDINAEILHLRSDADDILNKKTDQLARIDVSTLANEKFILLKKKNSMRRTAQKIFEEAGITPKISMEFDQLQPALRYANSGFGICFFSDLALRFENSHDNLNIYLPKTRYASRPLCIITKKDRYISVAASALIDLLHSSQ